VVAEVVGDPAVEAVLAAIGADDPGLAEAALAGFDALTWGEGLDAVTGHGLADFLWYQLPVKWMCGLAEKQRVAAALGLLFTRLGRPRYAAMCTAPATAEILTAYDQRGRAAGLRAYRAALAATGVQPPDIPGLVEWGSLLGTEEASAYWSASVTLEQAIDAGDLRPGAPGWRTAARQVTTRFLDSPRDEVTGATWLQWLHTERLQRWTESRGPARARLAGDLADRLTTPQPAPAGAVSNLAPLRWLLDHAAAGAPLTQNRHPRPRPGRRGLQPVRLADRRQPPLGVRHRRAVDAARTGRLDAGRAPLRAAAAAVGHRQDRARPARPAAAGQARLGGRG